MNENQNIIMLKWTSFIDLAKTAESPSVPAIRTTDNKDIVFRIAIESSSKGSIFTILSSKLLSAS